MIHVRPAFFLLASAGAVLLVGCSSGDGGVESASTTSRSAIVAHAPLYSAAGVASGEGRVEETGSGLRLVVDAMAVAQGVHGIHVHTVGKCDGPDFQTAGGHWNPTNHQHGKDNPAGSHVGDLPNIDVGGDGRGTLTIDMPGATRAGLLDADGAALVIHAAPDDYKTDPSGNSGARIACGVFVAD